nr:integrator complex subunit 6 [Hymenolepis microstoma]
MAQRTYQGTTLLDSAKRVVDALYKARMNKCRTDRFFLFTLNPFPQNVLMSVWRQGHDLPSLHAALSKINPDGVLDLGEGIANAFRILNLNRFQANYETYGMGWNPSLAEHAVVVVITHSSASLVVDEKLANKCGDSVLALTIGSHRWDYWLQGIILHYSGLVETVDFVNPPELSEKHLVRPCAETGGNVYVFFDPRDFVRDIENVCSGFRCGLMVDIVDDTLDHSDKEPFKQLVLQRENVKVNAFWPIPEAYWPGPDLSLEALLPRPSNPCIHVLSPKEPPPKFPENFPIDRYELDSSPLTQKIVESRNPSVVWPCIVKRSGLKGDAPFGYCKLSQDLKVHLYILPYNYMFLSELLCDLDSPYGLRITELWIRKMLTYYESIPRYYHSQLLKAFERSRIPNVIKTDGKQAISFKFSNEMQKLHSEARADFDHLVNIISNPPEPSQTILISRITSSGLMDVRRFNGVEKQLARKWYENASYIPRSKLRKMLPKLRDNFDAILDGIGRPMDSESIHTQTVSEMGNYTNYRFAQPRVAPLRDLIQAPERVDTFGNPFHRKSNAGFLIDEVSVDDMGFSGSMAFQVHRSPFKPRGRVRGPLPSDFRLYVSRPNNPASSPYPIDNRSHSVPDLNGYHIPVLDKPSHSELNGGGVSDDFHLSQEESAFKINVIVVNELVEIVRSPSIDGSKLYSLLGRLKGSHQNKYDAVSYVMAEALRLKRVDLFKLLTEYRSHIGLLPVAEGRVNGLDQSIQLVNGSR